MLQSQKGKHNPFLWRQIMETTFIETATEFAKDIGIAIAIGVAGYILAIFVGRLIKFLFSKFLKGPWDDFLAIIFRIAVIFLTIKVIVDITGTAGGLVVLVTAITAAFAIGSERLASDAISSIKLMFLKHYKVDDFVTVGGKFGKVEDINMSFTSLRTYRTDRIIIPNTDAINQIIVNHSQIKGHHIDVTIPVMGEHDHKAVMETILKAAESFPNQCEEENLQPEVHLGDIGVDTWYYRVWVFVPEVAAPVRKEAQLRLLLVDALKAAGVNVGISPTFNPKDN